MKSGQKHRFAFVALIALAACTRGGDEDPSAVLERAAATAQQLQSAAFDADFSYETTDGISVSGSLAGVLADGGKQSSFTVDADITVPQDGIDPTVRVNADVVVAGENEAYLKLAAVDGSLPLLPGIGLVDDTMLGKWLAVGQPSNGSDTLPASGGPIGMTADPSFIAMQASVLSVTNDRSYETVDDERCYAYDVTIDPAKMIAFFERTATEQGKPFDRAAAAAFIGSYDAKGTIWIDAATSVIRRIMWTFEPSSGTDGSTAALSVRLSKHNEPVEIIPPAAAAPFPDALPAAPLPAL